MANTPFGPPRKIEYANSSDNEEETEFFVPEHRPRIRYVIYCHGAQKHDKFKVPSNNGEQITIRFLSDLEKGSLLLSSIHDVDAVFKNEILPQGKLYISNSLCPEIILEGEPPKNPAPPFGVYVENEGNVEKAFTLERLPTVNLSTFITNTLLPYHNGKFSDKSFTVILQTCTAKDDSVYRVTTALGVGAEVNSLAKSFTRGVPGSLDSFMDVPPDKNGGSRIKKTIKRKRNKKTKNKKKITKRYRKTYKRYRQKQSK